MSQGPCSKPLRTAIGLLGRLNGVNHKRYRRDILLSLIGMHEKNQAWVDAAKSYERYLEEFAANDLYPFEDHEDAPGIPDLKAGLGSVVKYLEPKAWCPHHPRNSHKVGKNLQNLVPSYGFKQIL